MLDSLWYIGLVALVSVAIGALGMRYYYTSYSDPRDAFEELETDGGEVLARRPVPVSDGYLSKGKRLLQRRKQKQALKKGYIRWYLVGDSISEERYVKPERKEGGTVPELEHKGETYLFPESHLVPSAKDGVFTCVHRVGESEPVNLRSDHPYALSAHSLKRYLDMRVTSAKPGLGLGIGDWDTQTLMKYGILVIIGYFVLVELMGNVF